MELLDKLNEANMRADGLGYVDGLCVRADHQARYACSVAELLTVQLRVGVSWIVCLFTVSLLDIIRRKVVAPPTPVVPSHEDHPAFPEHAIDNRLYLIGYPFHAVGDVLSWVLA